MSGTEPDLAAPEWALKLIAAGITVALAELNELGMVGEASMGRGFSDLALSGMELGHGGLTAEFKTFCKRWEWGVRTLMVEGNLFAVNVGLSAGSFHEQDQYVKNTIKVGVNSLNGNPHLSGEEVSKKDWDEISSQSQWSGADWSAESFSEAHTEVKETWRDTGYDVMDAQLDSMEATGVIDPQVREETGEKMQEFFDPSDEAIQQAEQPVWGDR